ncbi:hypothetical protein [Streptomyces sp. NPDC001070]
MSLGRLVLLVLVGLAVTVLLRRTDGSGPSGAAGRQRPSPRDLQGSR